MLRPLLVEREEEQIIDDDAVHGAIVCDSGRQQVQQAVARVECARRVEHVLVHRLREEDCVGESHGQREAHGVGGVRGCAALRQLLRGERRQREVGPQPAGQAQVVVEVRQVAFAHEHALAARDLQLHQVRRVGQRHAGRVDEQSVGGLRVDDQTVGVRVLADCKHAVDREGRGSEADHPLLDEAADESDVLAACAGDARGAQGRRLVEGAHLPQRAQKGGRGVVRVGGGEVRGQHACERNNAKRARQCNATGHEWHDWSRFGRKRGDERERHALPHVCVQLLRCGCVRVAGSACVALRGGWVVVVSVRAGRRTRTKGCGRGRKGVEHRRADDARWPVGAPGACFQHEGGAAGTEVLLHAELRGGGRGRCRGGQGDWPRRGATAGVG